MKLSRRCFLSLSIGGAVGTAMTPLPWKLTDDLSIWSQNWPWTPVPPDGKASFVNSTCALCPGHCGIRVRKVDQRAVKIEGQEGTPLNAAGGMCLLGMSSLQLLYGPTRVKGPLRKVVDANGNASWEPISWQKAVEEVAQRMSELRTRSNARTVACLLDREDGTVPHLFKRLLKAYGSPNFYHMASVEDTYAMALALTMGIDGYAGLDVGRSDFILSFGSALLDGYGSPLRMMQAVSRLKEQHGTLVQVEPRLSNTAAKADIWLAAKPGTEADLAMAMAYVLIDRRRFNEKFVYDHIEDFGQFAVLVRNGFSPENVAPTTGIDAETIVKTALAFADAKRPLAIFGRGNGQTPGSLKEALAVNALNILVGNINQPGGLHTVPAFNYINWPEPALDDLALAGAELPRLDGTESGSVDRLFETVNAQPDKLQLLLVGETNPCQTVKDSRKINQVMEKVPFVVSFSSFMDETAMQADLILPSHLYLERWEDIPVRGGAIRSVVGLCRPVVAPQYDTQHMGDTIIQIAKAIKGPVADAFKWDNHEACLKQTFGRQWDALVANGYWEAETTGALAKPDFGTPSGKIVTMSDASQKVLGSVIPPPAGDEGVFPLLLIDYDSIRLSSKYVGDPPFMVKVLPDTVLKGQDGFVEVNPETADALGFSEGQIAILATPLGEVTVRVHLDPGIMPGLLAMPHGLGHTAYDGFLAGKGVNVNKLIAPVEDPASGLDAAWGIRAVLAKA